MTFVCFVSCHISRVHSTDLAGIDRTRQDLFPRSGDSEHEKDNALAPLSVQLSTVQALSPQISEAASALTSLELPFPPTSSFTTLTSLTPRMAALEGHQVTQALEISELRKRSMLAVSRYKKVHVQGQRDVWKEWSTLLGTWEREISREEHQKAREQE